MGNLYNKLSKHTYLYPAWLSVYRNASSSESKKVRGLAQSFNQDLVSQISRISNDIGKNRYLFSKAVGLAKAKKNKVDKRPIVRYELRDRVVQRCILDVLQEEPSVREGLMTPTSFGGIKDKGVPKAVEAAYRLAFVDGFTYFIKSDIKKFFDRVSKPSVISSLSRFVADQEFLNLFEKALTLELENCTQLEFSRDLGIFPLDDIGLPQGCCLSPLAANLILSHFDAALNQGQYKCLRYIDDFIILAKTRSIAHSAFEKALEILSSLDLEAYNPKADKDKAAEGPITKGFEFLGCDIHRNTINPTAKARRSVIEKVQAIISASEKTICRFPKAIDRKHASLIETLLTIQNTVKGWANQYFYCNRETWGTDLQRQLDELIRRYLDFYKRIHTAPPKQIEDATQFRRSLLGVFDFHLAKSEPIIGGNKLEL